MRSITAYTDYKSPYAYLAKDLTYALERDLAVHVEWLPYVLDIPAYLGSARVDAEGRVLEENRNAHQWRRVRYSYMDCRRQARKRGLVIRGPQKIWDSTLAAAGMLFAKQAGDAVFRRYHDSVFERFWKRELNIEDAAVIGSILAEAGADTALFARQAPALRNEVSSAGQQRNAGCSACPVSLSMASCSGAASIFPTSALYSPPDATGGMACMQRSFATATSSWTPSPTQSRPRGRCW
jgi:2-hydroxychromene-2-carboxylate isomerase